jgi:hypothetical protein
MTINGYGSSHLDINVTWIYVVRNNIKIPDTSHEWSHSSPRKERRLRRQVAMAVWKRLTTRLNCTRQYGQYIAHKRGKEDQTTTIFFVMEQETCCVLTLDELASKCLQYS